MRNKMLALNCSRIMRKLWCHLKHRKARHTQHRPKVFLWRQKTGIKFLEKNKYVDDTYSRAKIVYCVILCSDALFFDKTKEKNCACVSFLYFGRPLENVCFFPMSLSRNGPWLSEKVQKRQRIGEYRVCA